MTAKVGHHHDTDEDGDVDQYITEGARGLEVIQHDVSFVDVFIIKIFVSLSIPLCNKKAPNLGAFQCIVRPFGLDAGRAGGEHHGTLRAEFQNVRSLATSAGVLLLRRNLDDATAVARQNRQVRAVERLAVEKDALDQIIRGASEFGSLHTSGGGNLGSLRGGLLCSRLDGCDGLGGSGLLGSGGGLDGLRCGHDVILCWFGVG